MVLTITGSYSIGLSLIPRILSLRLLLKTYWRRSELRLFSSSALEKEARIEDVRNLENII